MPKAVRIVVTICLLSFLAATATLGIWAPADAKLWDIRFAAADRAPSGDIVFVDIDAASLAEIGTWPWPRSLHAGLLDRLLAMGAYEIAFDIDFSTRSNPSEDAVFAKSLEAAGGYAYLAAFRQRAASGDEIWSRPLPEFAAHAEEALVNIDGLKAGLIWSLPGKDADTGIKSIPVQFSPGQPIPPTLRMDYAIDLGQIVRVPAAAVLDGTVDPALLENKQVVIGTSAIELHDLIMVPRFGVVPGATVQIAAAETLKFNRALTEVGTWPALLWGALFLLGSALLPRRRLGLAVAVALTAIMVFEAAAFVAYALAALQFDTVGFHALAAGALVVQLVEDRILRRRQLREQHKRLVFLATHDDDTGALSERAWCDALDASNESETAGALLLRVEQAESAGASLGFHVADQVIRQFHDRLSLSVGGPVARIESQVFAIGLDAGLSDTALQRLIEKLELPYDVEGHRIELKLLWGRSAPGAGKSSEVLLQEARTALAMARRTRLAGCVYAPDFEAQFERRRQIDIALRTAVEKGELSLVFQRQVDGRTRQTLGVEALLRWHSAALGPVSPAEFIPLAEENGTIIQLGNWVAHEACRRAVESGWMGRLSINVAPVQFAGADVFAMVQSALQKSGFPADRLDVEITESLVADGHLSIVETLRHLRELGVSIAIDDFGTGHSSLSYLATLPVDKLKIDQSFVRQMETRKGSQVIKSIAALGASLGLQTIVEGVETEEELALLAAIDCDIVQGFLFGKPGDLPTDLECGSQAA
ncbi:hypothetical protein ASG47_02425 [Devosia sp. Leaf420]|uniref:EAL domain-containing protein n=1 Tax=Devosia sp. Leaf420 TaxID=1736374 RepID=UPI000712DB7C|nr:EAL domain-containing protein [Devosia sp. Leaf420]KQT51759.1 hypothetical protein ASG47_02425 [Devosia sp. Leaf420]